MNVTMSIVETPEKPILSGTIDASRLPILGEYIQRGNDWFQVKRVVHAGDDHTESAGTVYVIPIVDPTREPSMLSEWLEPGPFPP